VLLAQLSAAALDDLFLEIPRRDQPALRPQAIGKVEHSGKPLEVDFSQRIGLFSQEAFLPFAAVLEGLLARNVDHQISVPL
jgi:hypothetical protein